MPRCLTALPLLLLLAAASTEAASYFCRSGVTKCIAPTWLCDNGNVVACASGRTCDLSRNRCVRTSSPSPSPSPSPALPPGQILVKALGGSYKMGVPVAGFPPIQCPPGFSKNGGDKAVTVARAVIDAYWSQLGQAALKASGAPGYCKNGALFDNGKPVVGILYTSAARPAHNGVSACVQNNPTRGKKTIAYGQGIINYYCKGDSNKTKYAVGVYLAQGEY